jgi:hypothetical protein
MPVHIHAPTADRLIELYQEGLLEAWLHRRVDLCEGEFAHTNGSGCWCSPLLITRDMIPGPKRGLQLLLDGFLASH